MSEIWLGTISQPYSQPEFWVTSQDKELLKEIVTDELEECWGESPPFEWEQTSEKYLYCNSKATAKLRLIPLFD